MEHLYSIVIPVYRSNKSLEILVSKLHKVSNDFGYKFEILLVNDSPFSADTVTCLENLSRQYRELKIITLRKNQGQQIATLVGMTQALGDYIITMDDDLQHPPEEIPKLIKKIIRNPQLDGVFAKPNYLEKKHSLWRVAGSYFIKKIDTIFLKKPKGLMLSSFRIMTRDLCTLVVANFNAMPSVSSLMVNSSHNLESFEVKHNDRDFGKTNYTLSKLIQLALNSILHYSSLPLRIMAFVGLLGFIGSVIFILIIVIRRLMLDIAIPGYASTVTLISFFGGLNLFAVGLIGEYLIRVIREQQKVKLSDLIKK